MWQPRGLSYPLYTVLLRHHSEADSLSLPIWKPELETTRDAPLSSQPTETVREGYTSTGCIPHADASSNTTHAGCSLSTDKRTADDAEKALLGHTVSAEKKEAFTENGGMSEAVNGTTCVLSPQCYNSANCVPTALQREGRKSRTAEAASGYDGCVKGRRGPVVVENAPAAVAASSTDEQLERPSRKHHGEHANEGQEESGEKFRTERQSQQGRNCVQETQMRCQQKEVPQGHGKQLEEEEIKQQPQAQHHDENHHEKSQLQQYEELQGQCKDTRHSSRRVFEAASRRAAAEAKSHQKCDVHKQFSATPQSSCVGIPGVDVQLGQSESGSRQQMSLATCSSPDAVVTRAYSSASYTSVSPPSIHPWQYDQNRSQSFSQSPSEDVFDHAGLVHPAALHVDVSATRAATTRPTASDAASGETRDVAQSRGPSLRRTVVVPSFRVLILFGTTSGVSASVAFYIFHTLVRRLLSSSKFMHRGFLHDRLPSLSAAAFQSTAVASSEEVATCALAGSPRASSPKAAARTAVSAAVDPSAVAAAAAHGMQSVSNTLSESSIPLMNERDRMRHITSCGCSRTGSSVAADLVVPSLPCREGQKNSPQRCKEDMKENVVGKNTSSCLPCNTLTENDLALAARVDEARVQIQQKVPQSASQRQWYVQDDHEDQCHGRSHAKQEEKGEHVREEQNHQQHHTQRGNGQEQAQLHGVRLQKYEPQQQLDEMNRQRSSPRKDMSPVRARCLLPAERDFLSERRNAAVHAAEVASMGLRAAAALATAALKVGEQRDAARRAAAPRACETDGSCEQESTLWFLDEIQIGRVGVYIQSMQYVALEDFLSFVEESRAASIAAGAAAAEQAADNSGADQVNCGASAEADAAVSCTGATVALNLSTESRAEATADASAGRCLCANISTFPARDHVNRGDFSQNASALGPSGSCVCGSSLAAGDANRSRARGSASSSLPHTLVLYCISTDTGGAPPESAARFVSEVLDAADDFRVSRGSLEGCCVAGVGCGSTDYPHSTFCKPARQLLVPMQRLGAQTLMQPPLLLLTDTSAAATTEMKLIKWRQNLLQQIECLLQATAEEDVQRLLQDAKRRPVSSRLRHQPQQQCRQDHQQRLPVSYSGRSDALGCGIHAVEKSRGESTVYSRLNCGPPSVNEDLTKNQAWAFQDTAQDLFSRTDSSSYLESDDDDQCMTDSGSLSTDDDENYFAVGASLLPGDKGFDTGRGQPFFAGSALCGGSGGEDVEDAPSGEAADDKKRNIGSPIVLQHEHLQGSPSEVLRVRRNMQTGTQPADSWLSLARKRAPWGGAFADERRKWRHPVRSNNYAEHTIEKMVKPRHVEQLSKEGYRLIGSHSAVKLCRWTKSQLRGRGACYKHTFYGITSSQCMEMTPSLACANKCVFCWRHHKNPVGTSWKWQMDDEKYIVEEAITQHFKAIKELKGMAEVKQDRLAAARSNIRHCALSLVGEPIMYPRVAALVKLLHEKRISTFMVTNAQFPEALASLPPVTQLYLSVDAASPAALKAIDQPLFKDYWERFVTCMDILRTKRQRTVYRLTLVAGYNMPDLATLGRPCPTQSKRQSRGRLEGTQQASARQPRLPSDEIPGCHPPSIKSATSEKAGRSSNDLAADSLCACDETATSLPVSPVPAEHAFHSQSATSGIPPSPSDQGTEKEETTNGPSHTNDRGGCQDLSGRSAAAYAALVRRGLPDFIEVKAATYAGNSKHSKLTMKNIPWHDQVVAFCKDLCAELPKGEYELACVHRHSCCVLIAKKEYKVNDQWHTWINYEKFHELAASGRNDFSGMDYCAPTPEWATFGHIAAGFSPFEERVFLKGKQKRLQASMSTTKRSEI